MLPAVPTLGLTPYCEEPRRRGGGRECEGKWSRQPEIHAGLVEPPRTVNSATAPAWPRPCSGARAAIAWAQDRPGRDPVALFRILALQAMVGEPSIPAGVCRVRQTPRWRSSAAGRPPPSLPSAPGMRSGIAFIPTPSAVRAPSGRWGPVLARGEKLPPRRLGAIDRVATRVTRERARPRVADAWDARLAQVVAESVRRGALPATWDLAADGTGPVSGAHAFGRKICACPGRRCRCRRSFGDPTALLGWDSHRHRYCFGHGAQGSVVANPVPGQPAHPLGVSGALHPAHRPHGAPPPGRCGL